jgi:hypothetical protein
MISSHQLLKTDIKECSDLYQNLGFCIYGEQLVPDTTLALWTNKLINYNNFIRNTAVGSSGEVGDYLVLDGNQTFDLLGGLKDLYDSLPPIIEQISCKKILPSPYPLSVVNAKVYKSNGCQGAHFDTNPISCLLFVSDGAPLNIQLLNGEWVDINPVPGCIAIFQGRKCLHRVPPSDSPQFRVTIPMNYYHPDDMWRPEWIDEAIYLNKDYSNA